MFSGEMRVERRARGAWLPLVALIICFEVHRPAGAPETRPPLYLAVSPSGRKFAVPPEPPALSLRDGATATRNGTATRRRAGQRPSQVIAYSGRAPRGRLPRWSALFVSLARAGAARAHFVARRSPGDA